MVPRPNHLRVVPPGSEKIPDGPGATRGDLALLATLLTVNAVPLAAFAAGVGRWSEATLGFATACLLICGRELAAELRALRRRGRGSS
jgi:hypothetical protein